MRKQRKSTPFCYYYVDFYKYYRNNLYSFVNIRCAKVAIATVLYKQKYNKFPEQLSAIAPEFIPEKDLHDPYSGKLLQMQCGNLEKFLHKGPNQPTRKIKTGVRISSRGTIKVSKTIIPIEYIILNKLLKGKLEQKNFVKYIEPLQKNIMCPSSLLTNITYNIAVKAQRRKVFYPDRHR